MRGKNSPFVSQPLLLVIPQPGNSCASEVGDDTQITHCINTVILLAQRSLSVCLPARSNVNMTEILYPPDCLYTCNKTEIQPFFFFRQHLCGLLCKPSNSCCELLRMTFWQIPRPLSYCCYAQRASAPTAQSVPGASLPRSALRGTDVLQEISSDFQKCAGTTATPRQQGQRKFYCNTFTA